MRRKILSHFADTFCSVFVGWRFYGIEGNGPPLVTRDSGTLRYDVLNDACTVDGDAIPTLPVCAEIRLWFEEQLDANGIDKDGLQEAALTVAFRTTEHLDGSKGLQVSCEGRVTTDEKEYVKTIPHATLWSNRPCEPQHERIGVIASQQRTPAVESSVTPRLLDSPGEARLSARSRSRRRRTD